MSAAIDPVGTRLRQGGLMRCCVESIDEHVELAVRQGLAMQPGDRVSCHWCSSGAVIAPDGVWEWDRR